jgi:hypothetical protein
MNVVHLRSLGILGTPQYKTQKIEEKIKTTVTYLGEDALISNTTKLLYSSIKKTNDNVQVTPN